MAAQVTLSNLAHTYNGSPKSATVTTTPPGLNVTVTYAGSTTPPTNAGSYQVVATVVDLVETGSATATLVIAKGDQSITILGLGPKTYGDAVFTVTATANTGIPITEWQSSDPAVASVSPSGLVTIVGAGQTSIIASNTGNTNYNAGWVARRLDVAGSLVASPSGTSAVTYNGNAHGLDPRSLSSGQATAITYRDTSIAEPSANSQVIYQNGPEILDLSYGSQSLQAVGYWGMAKYISLGGTARKLDSCDVTLVSWARYDTSSPYGYRDWADDHPELVVPPSPDISIPGNSGGYYHPVTLSFYDYENVDGIETHRMLASKTVQAFIPWRPSTLADRVTPYGVVGQVTNGFAFRVPFTFPDGVILPPDVWVAVSFNTSSYGIAPIGAAGPYDSLNISKPFGPLLVGTTNFSAFTLVYKDWRWQNSRVSGAPPMLRLRALPTNATSAKPKDAGTYDVRTKASAFQSDLWSSSTLVINKAALVASLGNLLQIRDGTPRSVTVDTIPSGIVTSVSYAGSAIPPSSLGTYPVTVTSASPNYEGQISDTLQIGDSFESWRAATFEGSGLPIEKTTDSADPDGDGFSNLLEYAANLNPVVGGGASPVRFENVGTALNFVYRKNLHALDLDYAIQGTSDLTDPSSWELITPLSETTDSDDGFTKVLRAVLVKPSGQSRCFVRLKTSR